MARRNEDVRLVSGTGRYAADWHFPGALHACFVRSDRAHAQILDCDTGRARAMAGVHAVLTGADAEQAGFASMPASLPFTGVDGQSLLRPSRPVLAGARVRYVGEPIACVIAATPAIAADAAAQVEVEYRDLAVLVDPAQARERHASLLHDDVPRNTCFSYEIGDGAATQRAFDEAATRVQLALRHQRMVGNPLEPRACTAHYDADRGCYSLYTNTQGVNAMRAQLAEVVRCSTESIRIIARDVGGGFGVRYNAYPEHCVLMLAARSLKRAVRWVATRTESFVADEHGRAVYSHGEVALDRDGRFLAFRFRFLCDMGAYLTATGPFIDIRNVVETLTGVYRVPVMYARFDLVLTNTAPVGAYRGAGRPLAAYAVERLVEQAARETGIGAIELRRRNLIPRDAFPYRTPHAGTIDCGDFEGVLERALLASAWASFATRRAESAGRGLLRGIGLACYIEFSSPGFYPKDEVEIRFRRDGGVELFAVTHSSGQSHETTFAQIVSDVLGIAPERIVLRSGDPDVPLTGSATGGSRSLFGVGSVFKLAAEAVLRKAHEHAAQALNVGPEDVAFAHGVFRAVSTGAALPIDTLIARLGDRVPHPLDTRDEAKFGGNYPNGCHVAEVEIEPETGAVRLLGYTAVDDCGTVVNPIVVEGQVTGGVLQGIGQALLEHAIYVEASGQLASGSFADYAMPRAHHMPAIRVIEHPVPTLNNPLGAKGVGEAGATGAPAAVMNAVLDALSPLGVTHLDTPALPSRVWQAIRGAARGSEHRTPGVGDAPGEGRARRG